MINSKIVLPNKDLFQIKNHVQRIHLHVFCIYEKRRCEYSKNELCPFIFLSRFMEKSWTCICFDPMKSRKVECDYIKTVCWKDGKDRAGEWGGDAEHQGVGLKMTLISYHLLPFCMPSPMQFIFVQLSKQLNNHPLNSTKAKNRPRLVPIIRVFKCVVIRIIQPKCTFTYK